MKRIILWSHEWRSLKTPTVKNYLFRKSNRIGDLNWHCVAALKLPRWTLMRNTRIRQTYKYKLPMNHVQARSPQMLSIWFLAHFESWDLVYESQRRDLQQTSPKLQTFNFEKTYSVCAVGKFQLHIYWRFTKNLCRRKPCVLFHRGTKMQQT